MNELDTVIKGGDVLLPEGLARVDLGIKEDRVAGLYAPGKAPDANVTLDASGHVVCPGIVDIHFHVRAPSYPERGTVQSETRAAAAGGVTTIFEMPIAKPCCSTPEEL
jgi:dihydroorotase-like cyclic amidohydrolase